jgi:hypothetical protein
VKLFINLAAKKTHFLFRFWCGVAFMMGPIFLSSHLQQPIACPSIGGHSSRQSAIHRIASAIADRRTYILFNGPQWPDTGEKT